MKNPFLSVSNAFSRWINKSIILVSIVSAMALFCFSCKTQPPTVVEREQIVYTYKDSLVIRDSTIIIPIEQIKDITPIYDTLTLSTSLAISQSWIDTTNNILVGMIKNKQGAQFQTVYIDRYIINDSIVEKQIPVSYKVEVVKHKIPAWAWVCLAFSTLCVGWTILKVYLKFFK